VQAVTLPDHHARVTFCQRLLAKCVANTWFAANILLTDGIVNFHNTHVWVDDNPHTTMASKTSTSIFHQFLGGHLK
jgi:hypothetical protein